MHSNHSKQLPMPTHGREVVLGEVIKDLSARAEDGIKKYGTPLMTFNGRNALVDALQESYDQSMYLKQALMEYDDIQKMALKQFWKTGSENPSVPGNYPVILADTNGEVTPTWSSMCWDGKEWDLGIFTEGVRVVAWFDIPPFEVN